MEHLVAAENASLLNYRVLHNSNPNCVTADVVTGAMQFSLPFSVKNFLAERAPENMYLHLDTDTPQWNKDSFPSMATLTKFPLRPTASWSHRGLKLSKISWGIPSWTQFMSLFENNNRSWNELKLKWKDSESAEILTKEACTRSLKNALASNTFLEYLGLDGLATKNVDITEAAVAILQSSSVKCIFIRNFSVDLSKVSEALRSNKHIESLFFRRCKFDDAGLAFILDALIENTTLKMLYATKYPSNEDITSETKQSIDHYTRLNVYGRGKARDPVTTKAQFVELLHRVWEVLEGGRELEPIENFDVRFGLLLECPDKWCVNSGKNDIPTQSRGSRSRGIKCKSRKRAARPTSKAAAPTKKAPGKKKTTTARRKAADSLAPRNSKRAKKSEEKAGKYSLLR